MRRPALYCACLVAASAGVAHADRPILEYGDLSLLEEPIALRAGRFTITASGVIDLPVEHNFDRGYTLSPDDFGFAANGQIGIQTKLANRWTIGVTYFGQFDSSKDFYYSTCATYCNNYLPSPNRYNDAVVGYARTSWGTFSAGNIGNIVRNDTWRRPDYGEVSLAYDDFLGQLGRWGGAYQVRMGPVNSTLAVDQNGDFELGAVFQRPIGTHDIRFSSRFRASQVAIQDGLGNLDSRGVGVAGDLTYGSSIYDMGIGYEHLTGRGLDLQRWFMSGGARTKIGTVGLSAEGHYGQLDGSPEMSASAGLTYNIARGLSTNVGINYSDANVVRDGITILQPKSKSALASIRYGF